MFFFAPIIELRGDWFLLFKGPVEHKQYRGCIAVIIRGESPLIKKKKKLQTFEIVNLVTLIWARILDLSQRTELADENTLVVYL